MHQVRLRLEDSTAPLMNTSANTNTAVSRFGSVAAAAAAI